MKKVRVFMLFWLQIYNKLLTNANKISKNNDFAEIFIRYAYLLFALGAAFKILIFAG